MYSIIPSRCDRGGLASLHLQCDSATSLTHGWRIEFCKGSNFVTIGQISKKMFERELR